LTNVNKKRSFYFHSWSLENIKKIFPNYIFKKLVPFRDANILIIKKP